jgi:hypothetical protein
MNADILGPYDEAILLLPELQSPRSIRMSRKGKWNVLIAIGVPLLLFAVEVYDQHHRPTPGMTIEALLKLNGVIGVLLVGIFCLRPYLKHKRLISEGEIAIGRITRVDSGRLTWVHYEFDTPSGERVTTMGTTFRIDLSPGVRVPIFYDRENPKKQVALCTSFFEVVLPLK